MDGIIAGTIALGSLIPIIKISKDIKKLERTIQEMKGKPIVSPDTLLFCLKSGSSAIMNHFKPKQSAS